MTDLFLSYASEERERVRPFVEALEARGLTVWWDHREIRAGASFDTEIEKALDRARWVVPVWTRRSVESRWVRNESMAGFEKGNLIPVMFDDVPVPIAFRTTQAADLRRWRTDEDSPEFDALVESLHRGHAAPPKTAPTRRPKASRWPWAIAAIGALAAVSAAWMYTATDPSPDPVDALRAPQTGIEVRPSIAVLPFVDLGSDTDDSLFADGLTDEIIRGLQQHRAFPVISRHASFKFKGTNVDIRDAAAQLRADYVVAGTLRRIGQQVRITAELTNADGLQMWSDTFSTDLVASEVFRLQEEIAGQIAGITYPQLLASEIETISDQDPESLEAWDHLLRGLDVTYGADLSRYEEAIESLDRALELEPNLAEAYWARGELELYRYMDEGLLGSAAEARELEIVANFERALEISPFDGAICGCLGFMYMARDEYDKARAMFDAAVAVNPYSAMLRMNRGLYLLHVGTAETASAELEFALSLDPLSKFASMTYGGMGLLRMMEGDSEAAIQYTLHALRLEATEIWSRSQLPILMYLAGQEDQSRQAMKELVRKHPKITPRNRLVYVWLRPLDAQLRAKAALTWPEEASTAPLVDVVEHIYRELGWQPSA